jgi:hypothetical protein
MQIELKVWLVRDTETKDIVGIYETAAGAIGAFKDYVYDGSKAEVFSLDVSE